MVWFGVGGLFLIDWDFLNLFFRDTLDKISDGIGKGENPLRRNFILTL